jgi:hypothetical protein
MLQPLDVVVFKPLSFAYSLELTKHLHRGQGLVPIRKGNFFPLFWKAWQFCMTKKFLLKSFEATGFWPMDSELILKRFMLKDPKDSEGAPSHSYSNWLHMERLVQAAAKDSQSDERKQLSLTLYYKEPG